MMGERFQVGISIHSTTYSTFASSPAMLYNGWVSRLGSVSPPSSSELLLNPPFAAGDEIGWENDGNFQGITPITLAQSRKEPPPPLRPAATRLVRPKSL